jgi:predicted GNAT superfamily acetyltransferase
MKANRSLLNHHGQRTVMNIRTLSPDDVEPMWSINEQGLPGTGQVSPQELVSLLDFATLSLGLFDRDTLLGFVICLPPGTAYGSLNYAWFNQRYDAFLYVDRVAVATDQRNKGIGSMLYEQVARHAGEQNIPVAAEVNSEPPNPGSVRFHHRFGFEEVGVLRHEEKAVTMFMRSPELPLLSKG